MYNHINHISQYIIVYQSLGQKYAQNQQQNSLTQQQSDISHPTPSEIAAFASCLGIYVVLSYINFSFIRLYEVYNNIQEGNTNFTITPNINITIGFTYSCIGTLLRIIGAIQRVDEESQITIL